MKFKFYIYLKKLKLILLFFYKLLFVIFIKEDKNNFF